MTQKPISLEILNTKTEALFNALQVVCSGLSKTQQEGIAMVFEKYADMQFAGPAHAHVSDEAKKQGAAVFKGLADTIRESLDHPDN